MEWDGWRGVEWGRVMVGWSEIGVRWGGVGWGKRCSGLGDLQQCDGWLRQSLKARVVPTDIALFILLFSRHTFQRVLSLPFSATNGNADTTLPART